jgi:hypothetical protein
VARLLFPVLACCLALPAAAWAGDVGTADLARSIREAGLDPEACYRVHDLSLQKEDIRLYFTEGYLIFSKPVAGEPRSAVFTAEVEGGDGEAILLPPSRGERRSLALFTQSANLDEHFSTALMIFTDGSASALLDRINGEGAGRKAREMGALLAEKWTPVLSNVESGFQIRMLTDLLSPGREAGTLFVTLSGRQLGNFDIVYDPSSREQIMAGQLAERDGHFVYNIWTSFAARSSRAGTSKPMPAGFTLADFRIDAALDTELRMKAATRVKVRVGAHSLRTFPFHISHAMRVTAVRVDGAPAELFFEDSVRDRAMRGGDSDLFLAVTPEVLAAQSEHEFEFDHESASAIEADSTWYPRGGEAFANYDLTFRYPMRLTLVTAGDVAEERVDGDWRITRRRTPVPIRLAGFNLGKYEKVSSAAGGHTVEVYGSPPDPSARLRPVAADVASALEFFSGLFGPPALNTLAVAPITGMFGRSFPGLIDLPTPGDRDADFIEAREVARQWWGNIVTASGYRDEWLMEALSSYSALMWIEKNKGAKAIESILDGYREELLKKDAGGRAIESAGPIVWGSRLDSTGVAGARRAIANEKGAWIMHMVRRRLGDDRFLKMLAELRRRYEFCSISTDDFRALVREFWPQQANATSTDDFFDNWVYATGVPSLKLTYAVRGTARAVKVSGAIEQSGVADDFSIEAPVEIQFAKGAPKTVWVRTSSGTVRFSAAPRRRPLRVSLDTGSVLTAQK